MRSKAIVSVALLFAAHTLSAQCDFYIGHVPSIFSNIQFSTGLPMTIIDVSRPAVVDVAASHGQIAFPFTPRAPFAVRFASVYAVGRTYFLREATPSLSVTPQGTGNATVVYPFNFDTPIHFQKGDDLAVVLTSPTLQSLTLSGMEIDNPNGFLAQGDTDIAASGSADFSLYVPAQRGKAIFAAVDGSADCSKLPAPEVFFPAVGDVTGRVHYSTDVRVYTQLPVLDSLGTKNGLTMNWTLRDRVRNAGSSTVMTGVTTGVVNSATDDTAATITGMMLPYLGSLTVSFPFYSFTPLVVVLSYVSANARISSDGPNGTTGSTMPAISCNQIGHVVAVPFHAGANQRVNIGIASAQLNSCGIFTPATAVDVAVNGSTPVPMAMPGESMQFDDITGANSLLPAAHGLTDGVVYVTVQDEASRVAAYASVVDNTSQDSSITIGVVRR